MLSNQAVVTLMKKKGNDRSFHGNVRPISLFDVETKVNP